MTEVETVTPRRAEDADDEEGPTSLEALAAEARRALGSDDLHLGHELWGDGELPLVLLHGFTGQRGAWRHLMPHWAPHFRVLAVDLPGHGDSPVVPGLTFERTVGSVMRLVEQVGFHQANLLGYSLGARVALGLAVAFPSAWTRLVLESGSPGLRRRKARNERRRDDEELALSIEASGVEAFVERWEALPLFSGLQALPPQVRAAVRARRLEGSAAGYAASLRALGLGAQPNFWPVLQKLHVPALLVTGGRDEKFTATARLMAAQLPSAWCRTFADAYHAPHLEVSAEYAHEVATFLQTPWMERQALAQDTGSN